MNTPHLRTLCRPALSAAAPLVAPLAALMLALSLPAAAASFASSASSAGSASVGSLSDSIGGSSNASSGKKTAQAGEYRVVAVVTTGDRQSVQLQGVADAQQRFTLQLPVAAAVLAVGERIAVLDRPYGLAFARPSAEVRGVEAAPFFVALADGWRGELDLTRVSL